MEKKQNINIRIADTTPLPMRIDRDDEEVIRIAERNVNDLWKSWSKRFPDKSSSDILGMVAFRFAQLYFINQAAVADIDSVLGDIEESLDAQLTRLDD